MVFSDIKNNVDKYQYNLIKPNSVKNIGCILWDNAEATASGVNNIGQYTTQAIRVTESIEIVETIRVSSDSKKTH